MLPTLTKNDCKEFNIILTKIDNGTALYSEYLRFEELLEKVNEKIRLLDKLKKYGYNEITDYYLARQDKKKGTEGSVLGVILGIGLYVIIRNLYAPQK